MSLPSIPVPAKGQSPAYLTAAQTKKNRALFLKEKGVNDKINKLASKLGISPDEILQALEKETGGSFSPQQKNLGGGAAVGLIQFLGTDGDVGKGGKTINGKFYKSSDLEAMSTLDQLDVVGEYFQENFIAKKGKPGQLYLSIAAPSKVGKDPNSIGYAAGSKEALANPKWQEADGSVTLQSIMDFGGKPEFSKYTPSDANTPASGPEDSGDGSPIVNDDYEVPVTDLDREKQKTSDGIRLIKKSKLFHQSFKNTRLSEEDAEKIDNALVAYLQDFNETLPASGFGTRDKKLGKKGSGFHKKYAEGLNSLGAELTEGLNRDDIADWGKMAAIRRRIQANGKTEEFAKKALGDDFGGWGTMDKSLEYVMTERGEFDWSFGSYHDNEKLADHFTVPTKLRLELNTNTYVQDLSKRLVHPNEVFDSKDKNPLLQTPIFVFPNADISRKMTRKNQESFSVKYITDAQKVEAELNNSTDENVDALVEDVVAAKTDESLESITIKPTEFNFEDGQTPKSTLVKPEDPKDPKDTGGGGNDEESLQGLEESFLDKMGGVSSLIGIATGAIGLGAALKDVDIPKDPKLGPAFQQRLEESKNLARQGLTPSELAKAHNELDSSYSTGINNIVRGSAGNRAQFMAGLGGLDVARQSALMDISVADAQMQRENQNKYDKLMTYNAQYEAGRESRYLDRKYQVEQANKQAGAALAGAALSSVNEAIGDRQLNQMRKIQTEKMMRDMGYKTNSKGNSGQEKFGEGALEGVKEVTSSLLASGANFTSSILDGAKNLLLQGQAKNQRRKEDKLNLDVENTLPYQNGMANMDSIDLVSSKNKTQEELDFEFNGLPNIMGSVRNSSGLIN